MTAGSLGAQAGPAPSSSLRFAIAGGIAAATLIVFWPALSHDYIRVWDDNKYVTANPVVQAGLTWRGVLWAFTSVHASNWHPLTWLSHMADITLFGPGPRGPHAVNLLLHAINGGLLFLVLHTMTGATWRSALAALIFAIHPLRVESVAWIAERKDVLSGIFWLLTVLLYARYAERPDPLRYAAVAMSFALGLLAKPMLVTLPLVLVLFDIWPLRRVDVAAEGWRGIARRLPEKIPLLALAAASCVLTVTAQHRGGAVAELTGVPLAVRVANAAVSCVAYLWKAAWPSGLAPFYPLSPTLPPLWQPLAAAALLVVASLLAIRTVRTRPYFAVGWFAYLVMLLPVIGIVQVGAQSMADRYTYLPLVGVTIAVVWGAADAASVLSRRTGTSPQAWAGGLAAAALVAAACAGWAARHQTLYWKDGVTLWTHAVAVSDNCRSRFHLAGALVDARRASEVLPHYAHAIEQCPDDSSARYFFGEALVEAGQPDRAIHEYRRALQLGLRSPELLNNLGVRLASHGDAETALAAFRQAVHADPTAIQPRLNLAMLLRRRMQIDEARREYEQLLRLAPGLAAAHEGLAMTLFFAGDAAGAWREANEARRLGREPNPEFMRMLGERLGTPR